MKNLKLVFSALIALFVAVSFTACGDDDDKKKVEPTSYNPILFTKDAVKWIDENAEDFATKEALIDSLKKNSSDSISLIGNKAYFSSKTEDGKTTTSINLVLPRVITADDTLCTVLSKVTWKSADFSPEIVGKSELKELPFAVKVSDKWYVTTTKLNVHKYAHLALTVIDIEIKK